MKIPFLNFGSNSKATGAWGDVSMPYGMKRRIKKRLMQSISTEYKDVDLLILANMVKSASEDLQMPSGAFYSIRRRVLNYAFFDFNENFSFFRGFNFSLRTVSAFVVMIAFATVSIFGYGRQDVAYASDNLIYDITGDVYVDRGGQVLKAYEQFKVQAGDRIHTGYESSANILFFDDTVSRISSESKLNIDTLSFKDDQSVITIGVAKGRVWSRVTDLTTGVFNVATLYTLVKADKNAIFDVQASAESAQVSVVEKFVDVELSSFSPAVKTTVVEGESLQFEDGKGRIVALDTEDGWIRSNLSKDELDAKMIAQIGDESIEANVGALPDDPLYTMKTLGEALGVVLSLSERKKFEEELAIASTRLNEAELMIKKGMMGSGDEILADYKARMLAIIEQYPDLVGIDEVRKKLEAIIANDKRRYYSTLPGSTLSKVKSVVNEVEFLLANDSLRSDFILLGLASEDLYQAIDLIKNGGQVLAGENLEKYFAVLSSTFESLNAYDQADKNVYLNKIFKIAIGDLKSLKALEEVVDEDMVRSVRVLKNEVISLIKEEVADLDPEVFGHIEAELSAFEVSNLQALVNLSEFTGVNSSNAATVDVALQEDEQIATEEPVAVDEQVSADVVVSEEAE